MSAYFAGLLDGEGCVSFHRERGGTYNFLVALKMTTDAAIKELATFYGVNINEVPDPRPNHRMCYRVCLYGAQARDFLRRVRPHLRVKLLQANTVLRCNMRSRRCREETAALLKELNRRGTHTDVSAAVEAA